MCQSGQFFPKLVTLLKHDLIVAEKPSLKVWLTAECDLPIHDFLQRTNVARLLRFLKCSTTTATFLNDQEERRGKRLKVDPAVRKGEIVERLTKVFISDPARFIEAVENVLVSSLKPGNLSISEGTSPWTSRKEIISFHSEPFLFHCIASSKDLFDKLIQIMMRYVLETDFEPCVVKILRDMIKKVHDKAVASPIELYPSHLAKLAGLVVLRQNEKDVNVSNLIRCESLKVAHKNPFQAKVMLLLFPEILKLEKFCFLDSPRMFDI